MQATYDKLLSEVPKYKLITQSVLSDRLRVWPFTFSNVSFGSSLPLKIVMPVRTTLFMSSSSLLFA